MTDYLNDLLNYKNKAEQEAKNKGNNNNNNNYTAKYVQMPKNAGTLTIRILEPAAPGMFDRPKSPLIFSNRIHNINDKNVHCLKEYNPVTQRNEGQCPVCSHYNHMWELSKAMGPDQAKKQQNLARTFKCNDRHYLNCIVRKYTINNETVENAGPLILSIGKTLLDIIIAAIYGNDQLDIPPKGNVFDRFTGRDLKIIKTVKHSAEGPQPEYGQSTFLEPSPLGTPDQVEKWMAGLHDLAAERRVKSYDDTLIELKRHLGILPKSSAPQDNRYNPDELVVGYAPQEAAVVTTPVANHACTPPIPDNATLLDSESMSDDDFLNNIKGM